MTHEYPAMDPDWRALYAAGAIPEEDAPEAARDDAAQEFGEVIDLLAGGITPIPPPHRVRAALLEKTEHPAGLSNGTPPSRQVWKDWTDDAARRDTFVLRREDGTWEAAGVPGVSVRRLFVDRGRNQMTALIRMAAGASYPSHHHAGAEECLVLEGDLWVGDMLLEAGDYQRMPPGSRHGVQSTRGGCLLLITSSLTDEIDE